MASRPIAATLTLGRSRWGHGNCRSADCLRLELHQRNLVDVPSQRRSRRNRFKRRGVQIDCGRCGHRLAEYWSDEDDDNVRRHLDGYDFADWKYGADKVDGLEPLAYEDFRKVKCPQCGTPERCWKTEIVFLVRDAQERGLRRIGLDKRPRIPAEFAGTITSRNRWFPHSPSRAWW